MTKSLNAFPLLRWGTSLMLVDSVLPLPELWVPYILGSSVGRRPGHGKGGVPSNRWGVTTLMGNSICWLQTLLGSLGPKFPRVTPDTCWSSSGPVTDAEIQLVVIHDSIRIYSGSDKGSEHNSASRAGKSGGFHVSQVEKQNNWNTEWKMKSSE